MALTGAQLAMWLLDDPPRVPALARRNARTKFWELKVRHCCFCGRTHEHLSAPSPLPAAGPYRARCWGGRVYHVVVVWQSPSRASCRKAAAAKRLEDEARAAARDAKRRARAGAERENQRTAEGTNP